MKLQIETLLKVIVKTIKDREKRLNDYLLPLKYLLQYVEESGLQDLLKMELIRENESLQEENAKLKRKNKGFIV